TNNEALYKGLVPSDKKVRVFNYHRNTVHAFADLLGAAGLESPDQIQRSHVSRRVSREHVKTYEDLFPGVRHGAFLAGHIAPKYKEAFNQATASSFAPVRLDRSADAQRAA
ncbi:MAG: FMN-binding glutamate synthase family protein, partial [Bdellovibrionota bacterium]